MHRLLPRSRTRLCGVGDSDGEDEDTCNREAGDRLTRTGALRRLRRLRFVP